MENRFYFDDTILDRAANMRDLTQIFTKKNRYESAIIPVWKNRSLINIKATPQGVFLKGKSAERCIEKAHQLVFLGLSDNKMFIGADISNVAELTDSMTPNNTVFEDLRNFAASINSKEAGFLAYAKAMAYWNNTHLFCGTCGASTESKKLGHERHCSNTKCAKVHFPRTDPAVIMLVIHPDQKRCLLGRNRRFKGIRFSTIAGFVEPGESLEHAVAREVFEETSIRTKSVEYLASQPWPFPASVMIGFKAQATSTEIVCSDKELIEARWFSRKEIIKLGGKNDGLPPLGYSISRWLIEKWVSQ